MLKSMTAYGRAVLHTPLGRISVELQSLNRKHLEINTFLPSEFIRYDADIKRWIGAEVGRGQITVRVSMAFEKESPLVVTPNLALARQIKQAWKILADDLGMQIDDHSLVKILAEADDILVYDENIEGQEGYRQLLKETVGEALKEFLRMKTTEGKALQEDIATRLNILSELIKEIGIKAPGATDRYRQKLQERLQEVLGAGIDIEEKLLREVCVFAEKIDIAEELTRFHSHLKQATALLHSDAPGGVGKTFDFLVQELNREVNTIGSKSSDVTIAKAVIAIKSELERMREQIQNVE